MSVLVFSLVTLSFVHAESEPNFSISTVPALDLPSASDTKEKLLVESLDKLPADERPYALRIEVPDHPLSKISMGKFSKKGFLEFETLAAGLYTVSIEENGYYDYTTLVQVDNGFRHTLKIIPAATQAYIEVKSTTPGLAWTLSGFPVSSIFPVKAGEHTFKAEAFAYDSYSLTLNLYPQTRTIISINLAEALFRLDDKQPSRQVFRPQNAGGLGTTDLGFRVSNRGSASLKILNSESTVLVEKDYADFTTWNQGFLWDGRDEQGVPLPEGTYTYTIEASPAEGIISEGDLFVQGDVRIDYDAYLKLRLPRASQSGFLFSSDTYVLAPGGVQAGYYFDLGQDDLETGFAAQLGLGGSLELGLGLRGGLKELSASSDPTADARIALTWASIKPRSNSIFSLASALEASVPISPVLDPESNLEDFAKASLGLALAGKFDPLYLVVQPKLAFNYLSLGFEPSIGLALAYDTDAWHLALSSKIEQSLKIDLGLEWVSQVGKGPLALGLHGGATINQALTPRGFGGVSLWFVN